MVALYKGSKNAVVWTGWARVKCLYIKEEERNGSKEGSKQQLTNHQYQQMQRSCKHYYIYCNKQRKQRSSNFSLSIFPLLSLNTFILLAFQQQQELEQAAEMASYSTTLSLLWSVFLFSLLFITHPVTCDNEEDALLQGINQYRASLNLTVLTKDSNAACLAQGIADQFKDQPCTNTTGSNTVPGTEPQFPDYPSLLSKCHLNVSDTRDGAILPSCVPRLDPSLVLSNYTQTQYSANLNDTKYTGAGIGSDGNWIVVVLSTTTPEGSFSPYNAGSLTAKISLVSHLMFLLMGSLFIL